ncbi:MAG: ABC transporter permease, partial [Candidatus Rokubacteria bacterium]|nr:ABC transporter permease [Candidatus Rokubacteria bacterium]
SGADLWVVQKGTNGPFAETSRIPDDVYRVIRAVPGVRGASPVAFQALQFRVGPKPFRVQLIGYRLDGLGGPPAVVAGRPILRSRYEMVIGRESGLPVGTEIRMGRLLFTIVGLTEGIVSNAGDPVAYVSLQDAQELQFLKANEAVRNDRARLDATLKAEPALAAVSPTALGPIVQNTHMANAVLVRLRPGADPGEVARRIERWNYYRAMTAAEQEAVLAKVVIERGRQQTLLMRTILLIVSVVIIALIIYTMTLEKIRDIATLKILGAPDRKIAGLVLQEALALGLLGYGLGALLISRTYQYFPRRLVIVASDQFVLLGVVGLICVVASALGIWKAIRVDPTTALGGGA